MKKLVQITSGFVFIFNRGDTKSISAGSDRGSYAKEFECYVAASFFFMEIIPNSLQGPIIFGIKKYVTSVGKLKGLCLLTSSSENWHQYIFYTHIT